jgi:hypothetical protein
MQISNLGWSPSGPISRKRLCLVVKCRRSFSNVLWWNVAPFKLKFDIRSQYWFFCLDVYVSSLKSNFTFQVIIALDIIIMWINFPIKGLTLRAQKNPKLIYFSFIMLFLYFYEVFFLSFFMFSTSVSVCVFLFPHFLINDEAFLNHHSTRNAKWIHQLKRC